MGLDEERKKRMRKDLSRVLFLSFAVCLVGVVISPCEVLAQPKPDSLVWKAERPYPTIGFSSSVAVRKKIIGFMLPGESVAAFLATDYDHDYPICDGNNGTSGLDCREVTDATMHVFMEGYKPGKGGPTSPFVTDPLKDNSKGQKFVHVDYFGLASNNDGQLSYNICVVVYNGGYKFTDMWVEGAKSVTVEGSLDEAQEADSSNQDPNSGCRLDHSPSSKDTYGILRWNGQKWPVLECLKGNPAPWGSCFTSPQVEVDQVLAFCGRTGHC